MSTTVTINLHKQTKANSRACCRCPDSPALNVVTVARIAPDGFKPVSQSWDLCLECQKEFFDFLFAHSPRWPNVKPRKSAVKKPR